MLNWLKTYWPAVILALLVVAVVDGTLSSLFTCHPVTPQPGGGANEQQAKENCTALSGPLLVTLRWIAGLTHKYEGLITAAFTVVLAVFTGRLWVSTEKLWKTTNDSVKLAREEFISTHRPRIELHSLKLSHRTDDEPTPVEFRYVNSGDNIGHVWKIGTRLIYTRDKVLDSDLEFTVKDISPPMQIRSGQFGLGLTADKNIPDLILGTFDQIRLFCVAFIIYTDDLGTIRQTGFCRQYDPETDRWLKVEDPEYDYSY